MRRKRRYEQLIVRHTRRTKSFKRHTRKTLRNNKINNMLDLMPLDRIGSGKPTISRMFEKSRTAQSAAGQDIDRIRRREDVFSLLRKRERLIDSLRTQELHFT